MVVAQGVLAFIILVHTENEFGVNHHLYLLLTWINVNKNNKNLETSRK